MTYIRALLNQIASAEAQLQSSSFLAPKESRLIVDVFDNSASRQVLKDYGDRTGTSCLHAGLSADYAEVIWNEAYRVPSDINDDVCDYPLARNLGMLTVAVACEAIVSFIATGEQRHFTITLKDLSIQSLRL
ncbi:MAG: hypothetical protein VKJ24_11240 [Synechococcales bacterium]|nr:hypothetical protein [Synechococcales bacterium]